VKKSQRVGAKPSRVVVLRAWATISLVLIISAAGPAQAQSYGETVLHSFTSSPDGSAPLSTLVRDTQGNLYGTTQYGGEFSAGTIFKLDAAGNETVLYSFGGVKGDGEAPEAGLVMDTRGFLYGTTSGGSNCNGTVFKFNPSNGKETKLHCFTGMADGSFPAATLVLDAQGNLYGTTLQGGDRTCLTQGCGTVFKVTTAGAKVSEIVLYAFTGVNGDGASPMGKLARDSHGNLYGTTEAFGGGTVFKVDPTGKETILHTFAGGPDGMMPHAGLVMDAHGNLYGTTYYAGAANCFGGAPINFGCGTIFKVDTQGNETVLYSFVGGGVDGSNPSAELILDAEGNLYGTTEYGGDYYGGTAFKLAPTGKETVLYSFTDAGFFQGLKAGLVRDAAGNLYGDNSGGAGENDYNGFVFELSPP
jgi:uncharacterized repeat protein (TIGR03803 family)